MPMALGGQVRRRFDSGISLQDMEKHLTGLGTYIKDIVYGANDGIITTFAIVAGSAGADLSSKVILILGFANLLADGFSMAASNFLGSRSERDLFKKEEKREIGEVETVPDKEKDEIKEIFLAHGFENAAAGELVRLVSNNKKFWIDFMMKYELKMHDAGYGNEWKGALLTFIAFVMAGSLPIFPFLFIPGSASNLFYSTAATVFSLFFVGAARYFVTKVNWLVSGLEMLLVGGVAAGVAYLVGYLISAVV